MYSTQSFQCYCCCCRRIAFVKRTTLCGSLNLFYTLCLIFLLLLLPSFFIHESQQCEEKWSKERERKRWKLENSHSKKFNFFISGFFIVVVIVCCDFTSLKFQSLKTLTYRYLYIYICMYIISGKYVWMNDYKTFF